MVTIFSDNNAITNPLTVTPAQFCNTLHYQFHSDDTSGRTALERRKAPVALSGFSHTQITSRPSEAFLSLRSIAGVTLIELVVTVAVAAVLLTVAIPSFQSMTAKNRVAGLTNELGAALQLARSEAVKRGKTVTVCKSADPTEAVTTTTPSCSSTNTAPWPNGWLVFVDEGTRGTRDGTNDTLLKVGQPDTNNAVQAGADFFDYVSYLPNGASSGTGDPTARTLTVCIAPEQREIVIGMTGQISITRGACP